MRAVVQRVSSASVTVDGNVISCIGHGLLIFIGVGRGDSESDADYLAAKCSGLRIFEDTGGKMNLSVKETGGQALVVSQFTLLGDARKGKRPGFDMAMEPVRARELVERFSRGLSDAGIQTLSGVFGAHMQVALLNDGPVTILLDSGKLF
jgi:D-tyrosyl-tRNA(Tyr) deacylase